jgi:hypothetical protein
MLIAQANIQMDATGKITAEEVIVKKVISSNWSVQKLIIRMLSQIKLFHFSSLTFLNMMMRIER